LYFVPVRIVIPQLSRLAQSHNPAVREAVFDYLLRFPDDTDLISHEYLLSLCLPALTDPSPYVRQCAAHAAARAGPSASNAIPELIRSLQGKIKGRRKETFSFSCGLTAKALGNIGPPAASSVPLLLKELTNGRNDTVTLIAVTNALKSIDPEAAAKAGVK
jgi:hypothetical protein